MARTGVAAQTFSLCEGVIADLGYDLIDVEYVREGSEWFLRLYIDRRGGIGLEDCTRVSEVVDPLIEEQIQIERAYFLEVSSPGLDRPLKTPRDLQRHLGEEVEVTLYRAREGRKKFVGTIYKVEEDRLWIQSTESEEIWEFTAEERAKVKRVIRFH